MTNKQNDPLLRTNLKRMLKKTSKNDVLLKINEIYSSSPVISVELSQISDCSYLVDAPVTKESLEQTINSIKYQNMYNPLILRKISENKYEIVAGRRRYYAFKELNFTYANAVITNLNDETALICILLNSVDKHNKNILEQGTIFKILHEEYLYSLKDLSELTGLSISQISNLMRILTLSDSVKNEITNNTISFSQAKCLLKLPEAYQDQMLNEIIKEEMTVKELEKRCNSALFLDNSEKRENELIAKFSAESVEIKSKSITFKFKNKTKLNNFIKDLKK